MALCISLDDSNNLVATAASPQDCTSYVLVDSNEYQLMLKTYDITPIDIASSFIWGFGTYMTFWYMSFCVKSAKMTIRKL